MYKHVFVYICLYVYCVYIYIYFFYISIVTGQALGQEARLSRQPGEVMVSYTQAPSAEVAAA